VRRKIWNYGRPPLDRKWAWLVFLAVFAGGVWLSEAFHLSVWF
jgi:hypothetical protein